MMFLIFFSDTTLYFFSCFLSLFSSLFLLFSSITLFSGLMDYKSFSCFIYGIGFDGEMEAPAKLVLDRIRSKIVEKGGAAGVHNLAGILNRYVSGPSRCLGPRELEGALLSYGIDLQLTPEAWVPFMDYFDPERTGLVCMLCVGMCVYVFMCVCMCMYVWGCMYVCYVHSQFLLACLLAFV